MTAGACNAWLTTRGVRRQTKACRGAREILGTPAVPEEQRDRKQLWILVSGFASHTRDEHVEVIADVEFFEQGLQQPARPRETVRAFG